jgi:HK97 family phage prohead protease
MKLETKSFAFEVKAADADGGTFEGIGAVFNNVDAGFDVIATSAYDKDLPFFRAEGKVRDEHTVTTGRITDAKITPEGLALTGKISDTIAGRDQKTLLKDGVITRLSIGHYVLEKEYLETPEEVKAYWDTVGYTPNEQDLTRSAGPYGMGVRLIKRARPVEVSTTFNPMNDRAAITSVKADGQPVGRTFDAHCLHTLAVLEEFHDRARRLLEKRAADGRRLSPHHRAAFERLSEKLAELLDANEPPDLKGAVAFASAPVDDGEWDADAALKRLKDWANGNMAKYRRGFAWFDSAKADDFGSYKLPHHDVKDGKLVTMKRGVEAAAGAVDGARGGVSIPDGDKAKVKAHLEKHYHQWGGKAPWEGKGDGEGDGKAAPEPETKSGQDAPEQTAAAESVEANASATPSPAAGPDPAVAAAAQSAYHEFLAIDARLSGAPID